MGREAVQAVAADDRFAICSVLTRSVGQAPQSEAYPVYTELEQLLEETQPDVWLDFTDARSVVHHVDTAIRFGVRPVIGATGYTDLDLARWQDRCDEQELGGIAAPNFAIGALLMMKFATEAARYFDVAEIVELHHDGKKDAPSGTAKRTALMMSEVIRQQHPETGEQTISDINRMEADNHPARGLLADKVHVHSVRLPGLVAHQEVILGGTGETLTIRHDSSSRSSFMPGVLLACAEVQKLNCLVYGLENLLW